MFASIFLQEDAIAAVLMQRSEPDIMIVYDAWSPQEYELPDAILAQWKPEELLFNNILDISKVSEHPLDYLDYYAALAPKSNAYVDRAKFKVLLKQQKLKIEDFSFSNRLRELINGQCWESPLLGAVVIGALYSGRSLLTKLKWL